MESRELFYSAPSNCFWRFGLDVVLKNGEKQKKKRAATPCVSHSVLASHAPSRLKNSNCKAEKGFSKTERPSELALVITSH